MLLSKCYSQENRIDLYTKKHTLNVCNIKYLKNLKFIFKGLILITIFLFNQNTCKAQIKDTLSIYKKIKKIADKHQYSKLLYEEIFVETAPDKYEKKTFSNEQTRSDPNQIYKNKIIRNITIEVLDPFGYSVNDTAKKTINHLQKIGNQYHIHSRHLIIKNLLLFKEKELVNLFLINESERLLRQASYINDSRIFFNYTKNNTDSVDILVVVHDKWELDISFSGNIFFGGISLKDKNIFGTGQTYQQDIDYSPSTNEYQFDGNYTIGNLKRSYISSSIFYTTTKDYTLTGISFNRPFYSCITKWAGGITAYKTWKNYKYTDALGHSIISTKINYLNSDIWFAKNFNPNFDRQHISKQINFIIAARYASVYFNNRPSFLIDTLKTNLNSSLYLISAGISIRKYYKDQFIYRFGANEDVPEGLTVQILYGFFYKEQNAVTYYKGFEITGGKHFKKLGYLSGNINYGVIFNKLIKEDGAINTGFYYFSNLFKNNRWYFRQFINYKFIYGINKAANEKITLRPDEMYGFDNGTLLGTKK